MSWDLTYQEHVFQFDNNILNKFSILNEIQQTKSFFSCYVNCTLSIKLNHFFSFTIVEKEHSNFQILKNSESQKHKSLEHENHPEGFENVLKSLTILQYMAVRRSSTIQFFHFQNQF